MEELMIVANVAIVFGVIYKLFELFVGRKERMMLIEKLDDKLTPDMLRGGMSYHLASFSFSALRWGCLLSGLGVGLLAGFLIVYLANPLEYDTVSIIYGASVLLGGGLGLLASYAVELRQRSKE